MLTIQFSRFCFVRIAAATLALSVIIGAILIAWPKPAPVALVAASAWTVDGPVPPLTGDSASTLDIPAGILADPDLRLWLAYTPTAGSIPSVVINAPFAASPFMAIPYFGFPNEVADNRVYLRCLASDATLDVGTARTNTHWATVYLHMPRSFCLGPVELRASTASRTYMVGIGTPMTVSAVE